MPRINLLPWRAARRQERQRDFIIALIMSCTAAASIIFYVDRYFENLIEFQNQRNERLQTAINEAKKDSAEVDRIQNEISRVKVHINMVNRLQASRSEIVHLFDEIPKVLPEGIFINTLKQKDRIIMLEGTAQSNTRISTLMRNIGNLKNGEKINEQDNLQDKGSAINADQGSKWITDPVLEIIASNNDKSLSKFTLNARQINPADPATDQKPNTPNPNSHPPTKP